VTDSLPKLNARRMEKWAAGLMALEMKPGVRRFDLNALRYKSDDCGTVACAAGFLPEIFPRHWKRNLELRHGSPAVEEDDWEVRLAQWLGLTSDETRSIILVHPGYSTRRQVAAQIRRVVRERKAREGR